MQTTVLTLCGCPASGKSSLAAALPEYLHHLASCIVVSFDSIERGYYALNGSEGTVWDRDVWRVSRIQAYQCIRTILQAVQTNGGDFGQVRDDCSVLPEMKSISFSQGVSGVKSIVVVVDDTMHLKSMRKSVMKLCRECRIHIRVIL